MAELKLCPFCGEKPKILRYNGDGKGRYQVKCRNSECNCNPYTSVYDDANKAIDAWNDREADKKEEEDKLALYTQYRNGKPVGYRYGEPWVAMQLAIEGGYKTPKEAMEAWERENKDG